jgi:hypothetical protein
MGETTLLTLCDVETGPVAALPSVLNLPARATVPMPMALRGERRRVFKRVDGEARRQAALPVLLGALADVEAGWCQGAVEDGTGRLSLYGALATGRIESEYAREVVREVLKEWDLRAWNDHPARRKADVVQALRRAVARAGLHLRRGGWTVAP